MLSEKEILNLLKRQRTIQEVRNRIEMYEGLAGTYRGIIKDIAEGRRKYDEKHFTELQEKLYHYEQIIQELQWCIGLYDPPKIVLSKSEKRARQNA